MVKQIKKVKIVILILKRKLMLFVVTIRYIAIENSTNSKNNKTNTR